VKSFGLALGGGGARGLAHIAMLEAIDELELRPAAIAGTSIGALIGAAYAAGMPGKAIRRHVIALAHDRTDVFRRLIAARAGNIANLFALGTGRATLVDGEKFCSHFLPESLPENFDGLEIPLTVMASDLYRRHQVAFCSGPLRQALAASIALPSLVRPVVVGDQVLIDGGATNPLPFDIWREDDYLTVAVDVAGEPVTDRSDVPSAWESVNIAVQMMVHTITMEKLKHGEPDVLIRPKVGVFRTLDFLQASAILRASEPIKAEVKEKLEALIKA
jgi:NTE family protein